VGRTWRSLFPLRGPSACGGVHGRKSTAWTECQRDRRRQAGWTPKVCRSHAQPGRGGARWDNFFKKFNLFINFSTPKKKRMKLRLLFCPTFFTPVGQPLRRPRPLPHNSSDRKALKKPPPTAVLPRPRPCPPPVVGTHSCAPPS
jgi:hypothetical protein